MKRKKILSFALLAAATLANESPAQHNQGLPAEIVAREDGDRVEVKIFQVRNNALEPIASDHEFNPGDEIKVALRSNFDSHVYMINIGASGRVRVLSPGTDEENLLPANQWEYFPRSSSVRFDRMAGIEVMCVLLSREPIPFLATAIEEREGLLNSEEFAALRLMWYQEARKEIGAAAEKKKENKKGKSRSWEPIWNERPPAKKPPQVATGSAPKKGRSRDISSNEVKPLMFGINLKNSGQAR